MPDRKSPPRLQAFDELEFVPRFEYGEMADVAGVCGQQAARIPWTIRYDEVLTVFEGVLRVRIGGEVHELHPRDSLWLPAGTELVYEAEFALVHFAIHPADWKLPE